MQIMRFKSICNIQMIRIITLLICSSGFLCKALHTTRLYLVLISVCLKFEFYVLSEDVFSLHEICQHSTAMNYNGLTNDDTISFYPKDARRRFRATFQKEAPPCTTLIGWAKRFKATLSLTETARVGDHSDRRLSDDKRQEIGDDPTLSQRQAAAQ